MNPVIEKIRLAELESFSKSKTFKSWETIPVSQLRVDSYLNNPNSKPEDFVLYIIQIEDKLIAFRSFFAGSVQTSEGKIRFGWCSGNWVHPDFRRKGFSELLLNEAYNDWNGRLMFTNYAPNSEKLYLKSGKFNVLYQFNGYRGYLYVKTLKLARVAGKNILTRFIAAGIDHCIALTNNFRTLFLNSEQFGGITFNEIRLPDKECYEWIEKKTFPAVFPRDAADFQWIFNFPWISENSKNESEKYPFSTCSKSFRYYTIKVSDNNEFAGFFIFSVKDGHLKTLYFFLNNETEKAVAGYLKQFCIKHKIEVLTVYNSEVSRYLFARKFPFLRAKNYGQKIYSSFNIIIPENLRFQDGDGDVIFT